MISCFMIFQVKFRGGAGPHVITAFLDVLEALTQVSWELAVLGFLLTPEYSCP